jgi:hypothetical protein
MSLTEEDLSPIDNDAMTELLGKIRDITVNIFENLENTTRDNVELGGTWTAAGTFSTSALTGSTITFNIYQASGTQVAVQQGLDLTIV